MERQVVRQRVCRRLEEEGKLKTALKPIVSAWMLSGEVCITHAGVVCHVSRDSAGKQTITKIYDLHEMGELKPVLESDLLVANENIFSFPDERGAVILAPRHGKIFSLFIPVGKPPDDINIMWYNHAVEEFPVLPVSLYTLMGTTRSKGDAFGWKDASDQKYRVCCVYFVPKGAHGRLACLRLDELKVPTSYDGPMPARGAICHATGMVVAFCLGLHQMVITTLPYVPQDVVYTPVAVYDNTIASDVRDIKAAWSPDGSWVACHENKAGDDRLCLYSVAGIQNVKLKGAHETMSMGYVRIKFCTDTRFVVCLGGMVVFQYDMDETGVTRTLLHNDPGNGNQSFAAIDNDRITLTCMEAREDNAAKPLYTKIHTVYLE